MLARRYAIAGLTLAIAGAVGTAIARTVMPAPFIGGFGYSGASMTGYVIAGLTWTSVGALLVVRCRDNAVGWLMVVVGVGYSLSQLSVSVAFAAAALGTDQGDRDARLAGWVTVFLQLVTVLQFGIAFLFPTGRPQSPGWVRFMRGFWVFMLVFSFVSLSQPGPLQLLPVLQNPFGFGPDLRGDRPIAPILAVGTLVIFACLSLSMVDRYRSADRVGRLQLKWFVLASTLSAIGLALVAWEAIVLGRPEAAFGLTVYVFAGALVPVAIGIAITRYHLYDIDRIVSRSIAYAVVTAVLVAVVAVSILVLQSAISGAVAGPGSKLDPLVVAASTLLVAALFNPLRRRVQDAVDRRFHRAHYDAERTVASFAGRLRDELDLPTLAVELRRSTTEAVEPATTDVWLRATGGVR